MPIRLFVSSRVEGNYLTPTCIHCYGRSTGLDEIRSAFSDRDKVCLLNNKELFKLQHLEPKHSYLTKDLTPDKFAEVRLAFLPFSATRH